MTKSEIAKLYLNVKYGMECEMKGVKGTTFEEAIREYYAKGITIKRKGTGKLIQSLEDTMTVKDAIAGDWIPAVKVIKPNDVMLRKVKFIAECGSNIKYANIHNEEGHKEGWIILEDNKMNGMLSPKEMADKVEDTLCVEIPGNETRPLEVWVELIKNLF